ncbi:3-hydroxybutyrate dehydrogenase [Streptomyces rapamycinicus]|uniref:3-hydroxybutyrate dehydrogenase n=2 Tax=Streptomyces rapamycinicus TaxID=1226757 RepID=A0A0A0NRQ3_STRRN|nr:3-hydroxybutyrate dehydrogenase [Streptomyces rapamycinicus]AGP60021.1 3-hydroxybutyrate dehydrogenase [Streptomyces rapamycinicus NRRL 5491]MBB4788815.1 3-hydroxybutyrate dehydrogenase [Streptomyces rapamycinicus]RLV76789.1 3-hydroxybutyrate dehydrogenase [Streptomyces rapamycinicus NRRL 5491]UTO67679.1 3-hydroxybutyrate dehydrogenase [Streptomyces rapamycinicus]UTP35630.1 3-hydroxybutyrate dehydrogenase [Streptomyces rapamycinicus NRRL 5491]
MSASTTPGPDSRPSGGLDLSGRTALVTGAAGGIGRACALRLATAGARVRAVDLDAEGLSDLVAAATGLPGPVEAHPLDLTGLDAAERVAAGTDILVNNAGLQLVRPIEDFPPEVFSRVLTVMLEAPFRLVRGALPHMYAQGWGRIVNISSVHGLRASPYKSAYVAAKHGLEGLSKVAALEGAEHGVTSNCVNPGYVRTPLVERQIADQAEAHGISPERVVSEVMLADAAVKRLVEPEEVAEAVAYLCGPHTSFITGASLSMDGGWTAH